MKSNRLSCWLCWLTALAAMCLMTARVQAQDLGTKGYWLGVACMPLTDELRDELKLDDVQGVIIVQMIPQSPAAKAGLQTQDVLVAAGEKPLAEVQDLIAVVNDAQGKPLKLSYIRGGERREAEVTPAPRDELRAYPVPTPAGGPVNIQILRPGRMVPPHLALRLWQRELPEDMTVTIKKHGKEPAQISVSQGDKTWEATEDKLDELPAEVRQHVEPMLGRVSMALPAGVGDVLTYIPDVDDLHARTHEAREAARRAGREAEEAARHAAHEAEDAARNAGRTVESQARDLQRQAMDKVREAREAAGKYVGEKADAAIEEGRKWVDRHLDDRFDDVNRRLDELRKMIDVLRSERAAPAPAAEPVAPPKPETPAEKPEDL